MSADKRLKVVICWHMHQPQYLDAADGCYVLPWTYLHAIKDYTDMAVLLEQLPAARAVVNFAPILLEQLDDYAQQLRDFLDHDGEIRDALLNTLAQARAPQDGEERRRLMVACLRANEERLVRRFPVYDRLAAAAKAMLDVAGSEAYLEAQFFLDLLVWYHLAWLGETVRMSNARVQSLIDKGCRFSSEDCRDLLVIITELVEQVIPRYRALAESGRVELSFTPYAHPIVPLLLDFNSAREAMPDAKLPKSLAYPGGATRARWHFREGLRVFEDHFGFRPRGCWPSEGGVSEAMLPLADEFDIAWMATGESVLRNSLRLEAPGQENGCIHRLYQAADHKVVCAFRDDGLSDLIGFTYSSWHADDAVANLIHHLDNIHGVCKDRDNTVVSIILDGENAWEHYPENGYHFLSALYQKLAEHPKFDLTTFGACLEAEVKIRPLQQLVAGSWVYGTFSTWIADKDKNRGWDLLVEAKQAFDKAVDEGRLVSEALEKATRQLAVCEGSDWFWWFGDYNPSGSVADFDRLFRAQLKVLYQLIGEQPPLHLQEVISHGGGQPATGGVMRPGQEAHV